VTTGTLTEAMPVVAGQTWSTTLSGISMKGLRLSFS
jgi:2-keto-4-pentenoate hydratase